MEEDKNREIETLSTNEKPLEDQGIALDSTDISGQDGRNDVQTNSGETAANLLQENSDEGKQADSQPAKEEDVDKEVRRKKQIYYTEGKISAMTYAEVVDAVGLLLQQDQLPREKDINSLESAFLKKKEALEQDESKKEELADARIQALRMNDLIADYKVKLKEYQELQQKKLEEAASSMSAIVTRLEELVHSTNDFGTVTKNFREIETEWRDIPRFSDERIRELQEKYGNLRDNFYDMKQLNDEFRDIDFRKNLDAKEKLIARAEELTRSDNPMAANREIGELHAQWKEIGPVAKDLRDEIWEKFTHFSKIVRGRGEDFFNNRKDEEEKNLEAKKKLCEAIEAIDYSALTSISLWDKEKDRIIQIQKDWKEIGPTPRNQSSAVYKRFRAACDYFFLQRATAFKSMHEEQNESYKKKLEIVEEAEALSTSQDWNKTANRLKEIQRLWSEIGFAGRKNRVLWQRMRKACDTFFDARKEHLKEQKGKFQGVIDQMEALISEANQMLAQEVSQDKEIRKAFSDQLYDLIAKFKQASTSVPSRVGHKIIHKFYEATNMIFDKWKLDRISRQMENFTEKVAAYAEESDLEKMRKELTYLNQHRERNQEELRNLEANTELMTASSSWGNSMLEDMEKKKKTLQAEIELIQKKTRLLRKEIDKVSRKK